MSTLRWCGFGFILCTVTIGPACGSSSSDAPAAGIGDPCPDKRCKEGLYCASGGDVPGLCTADCTGFGNCEPHFGNNTICSGSGGGVCLKLCTQEADCNGAHCVALPGLPGKSSCR